MYTPLSYLYQLLPSNASFLRWHFETQHPGDTPVIRLNQNDIYILEDFENSSLQNKYTQQKKFRKSQKPVQHKNTKANNYSIFVNLFRYMSSVEKIVNVSLLAPILLLWNSVKLPRGQSHFSQKLATAYSLIIT